MLYLHHTISTISETVRGLACLSIEHQPGLRPNACQGMFYQLPPSESAYANCEFRRMIE